MKIFGLAVPFFLITCTSSMHDDWARLRAEIRHLEKTQHRFPQDAPLWISEEFCLSRADLSESDAFENQLQDHTSSIPDTIYNHIMDRLNSLTDETIQKKSSGPFPLKEALSHPDAYRGKIWRITGIPVNLRHETLDSAAPIAEAFSGAAYTRSGEPFLYHVLKQPDPIHKGKETIELVGVFVKIISVGPPENRLSAPLFFARSLKKYL